MWAYARSTAGEPAIIAAPGLALHKRTARQAGLGVDEIARAREWGSGDAQQAALLRYLEPLFTEHGRAPHHLHEEARESGWTDEQLLEVIVFGSIESFTTMVKVVGEVPVDGSVEDARTLEAA